MLQQLEHSKGSDPIHYIEIEDETEVEDEIEVVDGDDVADAIDAAIEGGEDEVLDYEDGMDAEASYGEIHCQLTDVESKPIEGFTFEDCVPLKDKDSLDWQLAWRNNSMDRLIDKVIRLEVKLRDARLYAFRGDFHFIDAQDMWMLRDNKTISTSPFVF